MKRFIFVLCAFLLFMLVGCDSKVSVSFDTDGAQQIVSREYEKGEKVDLPIVSKEGHTFKGWFLDKEFKKEYKKTGIEEDTKLYAKWEINKFTVKFVDHDGTQIGSEQVVEYGKAATAPANPTRVGYTFSKWDRNYLNVRTNLTVTAMYDAVTYVVKFVDHDGTELKSQNVEHDKGATAPANPTRVGYTFSKWDKNFSNVTSALTVTAVYEINKYTVKFVDHDGTELKSETVEHGKGAPAPANPTRLGYTFSKWDNEFSNVTSDLTINAVYTVDTFEVKFVDHDGTELKTETVEYGKSATAPSPTREGYTFNGWDKAFNEVKENLTITATYVVKTFKVEFRDFDGKTIGEVQTVEYGKSATAPEAPVKEGCVFDKWNQEFAEVKGNLIIIPTFTYVQFNIKYYDGANLLDHIPATFTIMDEAVLSTFDKEGFTFVGWYSDEALTVEVHSIVKGTAKDVVLYGKWLDNNQKYNLTYELNGGKWSWDIATVSAPAKGIDAVSDLPELFMQDFYTYLKDNNLLSSTLVSDKLRKTTWEDFKKSYTDPVAIYNHTSSNTAQTNDGYSQFFYTTATGNATTNEVLTIEGGFFGTEPYKTKYANLLNHLSILTITKYTSNNFWGGPSSKSLAGFAFDGYFYGTQGSGSGNLLALRSSIPTPKTKYLFNGSTLNAIETSYEIDSYVQGLEVKLAIPFRLGYSFGGWYTNPEFTGEKVFSIPGGVTPATTYYAKWVEVV